MQTPSRLSTIKHHTTILRSLLGVIVLCVITMLVVQSSGNSVNQYRDKTTITFQSTTSGSTLSTIDAEIADTAYKQQYGLMFRGQLERGDGMIFVFDDEQVRSFWMKNTYIPLDMIFVNASGVVVSVYPGAKPLEESPISSILPAKYVVEVSSGRSVEAKIQPGVQLTSDIIHTQ